MAGAAVGIAAGLKLNHAMSSTTTPAVCGAFELIADDAPGPSEASSSSAVQLSDEEKTRIIERYHRRGSSEGSSLKTLRTYLTSATELQQSEQLPAGGGSQAPPTHVSGLLVYQPDGQMYTQVHDAQMHYTGYSGRWWLHTGMPSASPPHGSQPLLEHYIKSASDPKLVGTTIVQEFALSDDGKSLTTRDMHLLRGKPQCREQLKWRRLY